MPGNLPDLSPRQWARARAIFDEAVGLPADDRPAFLERRCGGDRLLHRVVESLLEADAAPGGILDASLGELSWLLPDEVDAPEIRAGDMVRRYRVVAEIGRGGMGVVYQAEDPRLERFVALKFLPGGPGDAERVASLLAEARTLAALDHTNIATVHEIDVTPAGRWFMVMAYYEGETLAQRLERGVLSRAEAVRIASGIARGLAVAHQHGVVHRDVKPHNVVLRKDGEPMLVDFGIASLAGGAEGTARPGRGTVAYMSPERVAGAAADARTDVWALGVVLYEMLAGGRPFEGETTDEVLTRIRAADPPVLPARVGRDLERVVRLALARDPAGRFADAREMLRELGRVRRSHSRSAEATARVRAAPRSRRNRLLVVSSAALLVLAPLAYALRRDRAVEVSAPAVAVLPFEVRGSQDVAYLREGIMDLLATSLDGAGEFRKVDPRATLSLTAQVAGGMPLPDRARSVAERQGARFYVMGSAVEVEGRLRIVAALHDRERGAEPVARAAAAGAVGEVFDLVDRVAAELLAGLGGAHRDRLVRVATVTTRSVPALRAYLEGEGEYRAGRYTAAVDAFQRAAALDTTFALAYYRLSIAADWAGLRQLQVWAAERAARDSLRLAPRERLLVGAHAAYLRGDDALAERVYRGLVGVYTDDVEAWYRLGEVLFHLRPRRGGSAAESRAAFERVLSLEPEHLGALLHLARIAALEGSHAELDALAERVVALRPGGDVPLQVRALRAFARGDEAEAARVIEALREASDGHLVTVAWVVDVYSGNLSGATRLARLLTDPARAPEVRALGHVVLAHLELARGRGRRARSELAAATALGAPDAAAYRALFSVLPFLPPSRSELLEARAALAHADSGASPGASVLISLTAHEAARPLINRYLLALLSARLDEEAVAERYAAELERSSRGPERVRLGPALAAGIRAQLRYQRKRFDEALEALEGIRFEVPPELFLDSPFYSQSYERYLRAETLAAVGRPEEALRWYGSFAALTSYDLIYVAPSHLRRAQIYERLGDRVDSARHYARFIELWRECDPELRPLVREAARRLVALGVATADATPSAAEAQR